jgi:thiamine-monophosphate kinase
VQRKTPITGESELIDRYFRRPSRAGDGVVLGIGDDAAIVRMAPGYDLVVATDTLAEGAHFPKDMAARSIGHRCLAVNLSDLAAMGAEPLWASLALSVTVADPRWLRQFAQGFFALARRTGVSLIGGDTIRGPLVVTVTVHGRVRPRRYVTRGGARPGDGIYVSGNPGEAVAGRLSLTSERASRSIGALRRRFLYPEPRLGEGAALAPIASAMIDVSDGLHDDAGKLLAASGCGAELDAGLLPLSRPLLEHAGERAAREYALTGGDDYELLFTVPASHESRLRRAAGRWTCPLTRIGTVTAKPGLRWRLDGRPFTFRDRTYRHFR